MVERQAEVHQGSYRESAVYDVLLFGDTPDPENRRLTGDQDRIEDVDSEGTEVGDAECSAAYVFECKLAGARAFDQGLKLRGDRAQRLALNALDYGHHEPLVECHRHANVAGSIGPDLVSDQNRIDSRVLVQCAGNGLDEQVRVRDAHAITLLDIGQNLLAKRGA